MERKNASIDRTKQKAMEKRAQKSGPLAQALWNYACYPYGRENWESLSGVLRGIYGKAPEELKTAEEFWNPAMRRAVKALSDRQFVRDMEEITRMRMEGQFSSSMWRRSYRSADFGYHAFQAVSDLAGCLYLLCYEQDGKELLFCSHDWLRGFDVRLALELRRGNREICAAVWDALSGDNGEALLSSKIIRAVVISGQPELLDRLLKLLLAARLQEGLRQQILENADAGSIQTLTRILKLCIDEDLFRFSSVARAFDTWTGLGFGDADGKTVKKCAALAYECLTNPEAGRRFLDSPDNLEAYFALWAAGCHEAADTDRMVRALLEDEKKYRRILGWLFISRTDSPRYQMRLAQQYLGERDEELLAWITGCLSVTFSVLGTYAYTYRKEPFSAKKNPDLPDTKTERRALFGSLEEAARFIGNKNRTFTGNPFAFVSVTLENTRVISCMLSLAGYDLDEEMTERLAQLRPFMDVQQRSAWYGNLLQPEKRAKHRAFLREGLQDRSVQVKELAAKRLSDCSLEREDLEALAESLRSRSSGFRKAVLSVLQKQKPASLASVVGKMLSAGEEYQIQAAAELLLGFREEHPELLRGQADALSCLKERKLSTQTRILLDRLDGEEEKAREEYTEENGFGLYDPKELERQAEQLEKEGLLQPERGDAGWFSTLLPSEKEYLAVLERLNGVFARHADYEYETESYDGARTKVLFGNVSMQTVPIPASFGNGAQLRIRQAVTPEMIPFWEEFREAFGAYASDPEKMLGFCYTACRWNSPYVYRAATAAWFADTESRFAPDYHTAAYGIYQARYWQMMDVAALLVQIFSPKEVFPAAFRCYRCVVELIGRENLSRRYLETDQEKAVVWQERRNDFPLNHRMAGFWRRILKKTAERPEDFRVWFRFEYALERQMQTPVQEGLQVEDFFRACEEQLLPAEALYQRLLVGSNAAGDIGMLTAPANFHGRGKRLLETWDWAQEAVCAAVRRIVEVEEKRGELPTPLTSAARAIERFEGAEYFCGLLAALGKEPFFRGYLYSSDTTKRAVLSRLLKRCYPAKEDSPQKLKELLSATDIGEKRLAEAAMYAPQWAGLAEQILGWPGLKKGVWFFQAHINETFSAEKETEVALYSPISPQRFNDGAFDRDWFLTAYGQLGEKRFHILYQSAKYITSGSSAHRRSQLYADAVLGKLDAGELEKEIGEKRNQEKLRCYPLIPIAGGDRREALRRYEFIQRFLKESRQFGAQRRESERKAVLTAMENLALTTGFMDVNRMTWYLESEKMKELAPFFDGVAPGTPAPGADGVLLRLSIDAEGNAALAVQKNGKTLKTLPKALNKDETVLEMKETVKELKEQKRRAVETLERAMTEQTVFQRDELEKILENPVLAPQVSALLWIPEEGGKAGFPGKNEAGLTLTDIRGELHALPADAKLRVAHPHDLIAAGEWAQAMHLLYEKKRKQPFKQVFREYYPLTEEERQERILSRRYAGHQVQPQKTVALLRSRGWTVDYEEGLQKVFYRENLIVRMYALADWFSPADIEAPTLEEVRFFDRATGKAEALESVPPILFSETMRDIDLAVSVAHAGGVDPEASHSTVEMRAALAKELVSLLKLSNVSFAGSHARIRGSLADYSVHLGSGVVHGEGLGMIAVLPVHSQARGRIFLPFADDDPKTAEILSKILLFAEDKKIKDPAILDQIRG